MWEVSDPDRRVDQRPFDYPVALCRRIMIACALISRPTILIADEPSTALDVTIQAQILDLLRHLAIERRTAVVLITHDMGVVADIANRVAVMSRRTHRGVRSDGGNLRGSAPPLYGAAAGLHSAAFRHSEIAARHHRGSRAHTGRVPSSGCRFANRCPRADARCSNETPRLRSIGPDHFTACHHAEAMA